MPPLNSSYPATYVSQEAVEEAFLNSFSFDNLNSQFTFFQQINLPGGGTGNQACTVAQAYNFSTGTSVIVMFYDASTSTSGLPASGFIQWDNATQIDSNNIFVNKITKDGIDMTLFLQDLVVGSQIVIQDKSNSSNFQKWVVNDLPATTGTVWRFPVLHNNGTYEFSDGQDVFFSPKAASVPPTTDELTQGTTNLYYLARPVNQVLLGAGTGANAVSSAGFTFDPVAYALTVAGGSPLTGGTAAGSVDFAGGRGRFNKTTGADGAIRIDQTWNAGLSACTCIAAHLTDTASADLSYLIYYDVNAMARFTVTKTGSMNLGVNSSTPFADGVGPMIAMESPATQPTTAAAGTSVILSWDNGIKRVRQIDNTGTVLAYATTADITAAVGAALLKANNLSDLTDASVARGNLGLGSAALASSSAFDPAGAAAAAQATAISTASSDATTKADAAQAAAIAASTPLALADGYINIGSSGNVAVARLLSGPVTVSNAGVTFIASDAITTAKILDSNVTLAKIANINNATILGNNTGGAAAPVALTAAQVITLLALVNSATSDYMQIGNVAGSQADITANYTVATTDANRMLNISGGSSKTITIPCDTLATAFGAGFGFMFSWNNTGTGTVTFAASGAGAAAQQMNGAAGLTAGQYRGGACFVKSSTVVEIYGVS